MTSRVVTIAEASSLIAQHKVSSVELVEGFLSTIASRNPELTAFVTVLWDRAREAAKRADWEISAGHYRGPLHGIPLALKDNFDLSGVPTTGHSSAYRANVPIESSAVAESLTAAGAIILGKLAMYELALGGPSLDLPWPPAHNPWNLSRVTGGSSSGTGSAVAAGLVMGGTGSDTAGSIRFPSAYCGVAGLKPTYGLVSRRGMIPLARSLDTAGPMAWTAEDCAILLQAMAGHDLTDPSSACITIPNYTSALSVDLSGVNIGIVRHFYEEDNIVTEDVSAAIEQARSILEGRGAKIHDVRLNPLADYSATALSIMLIEGFAEHQDLLSERPESLGAYFRERMALGAFFTTADYLQAQRRRRTLSAGMAAVFETVDVLITAITPGEAPAIDQVNPFLSYEKPLLSSPFTVSGGPAMSICSGYSQTGLPLAIQIAGKPFDEATVLRVAHAYEKETTWRSIRPSPTNENRTNTTSTQ